MPSLSDQPVVPPEFAKRLCQRLNWVTYPTFERIIIRTLSAHGFSDIVTSGRTALKGRTIHGGLDLMASSETTLGQSPVLIQIKRSLLPLPRHFVDELRGTMLRRGAPSGLIVTLGPVAPAAYKANAQFPGRPIRLIDGLHLVSMMAKARVGVTETRSLITGESKIWSDDPSITELDLEVRLQKRRSKRKGGRK